MRSLGRMGRISGVVTMLALMATLSLSQSAQAQDITEEARQHFRAGVNFLQDPDGAQYEEAYREFKAAYAASPSWKILGNLGLSAMKLERDGEAIDAFEKYLAEGGDQIDPAERAQVERDTQMLKAGIVTLNVESVPDGALLIDERTSNRGGTIVNNYGPLQGPTTLRVRAGLHRVTARLAGYDPLVWEVDGAAGSTQSYKFELKKAGTAPAASAPAGEGDRPVPTSVYIGAAATGALLAGGVVTGILAVSKNTEYDDANRDRSPDAEDLRDQTKTLNLVTDILLGGAVVGAAVTSYLYFTRPTVTERDTASIRLAPTAGPGAAGVVAWGQF